MYQISLSGGMGSAISTLRAWEKGLEFNMIFADTLIEDEDLYRFVIDVAMQVREDRPSSGHTILSHMARSIPKLSPNDPNCLRKRKKYLAVMRALANDVIPGFVWLADGRTPWEVYEDKRWIGNTRTAHCSSELKNKQVEQYFERGQVPVEDVLVLGMDWSEMDRIERAQKNWHPRPVTSLLNDLKVERPEYDLILNRYDIKKPRLYDYGFSHNNCGGFCCKAGLKQFSLLEESFPERYQWHARRMDTAMDEIGPTAKPFLRKVKNGVTDYLTLTQYHNLLKTGDIEVPAFDAEGCGCFTD